MGEEILRIENLSKEFPSRRSLSGKTLQSVKAVQHISLSLNRGENLGIVGESGCGKSTLGRVILRLLEPTEGKILFDGIDLTSLSKEEMRNIRKRMQIIFQDPYASLNPRATVREIISGPLDAFQIGTPNERQQKVLNMLERVGLNKNDLLKYPHEFSGGQRQRIMIARALILEPELLVCDEPVSALDVSVRSQVLNLLKSLQKQMGLTSIFISHDLSVVKYICNRVVVMYLGHIVEMADKKELYEHPKHPYTQALLSAIPVPDVCHEVKRKVLKGDLPSPVNLPSGCIFHTRCPYATEKCRNEVPVFSEDKESKGHFYACHYEKNGE